MSRVLAASTVVTRPGEFTPTFLAEGDPLPEWATELVGDHLVKDETTTAPVEVATITDTPEPEPVKARTPRARKG